MIQNRKGCSKAGKYVLKRSISCIFVPKSVQKCDRTSHALKRAARTHIPHTFQNGFCTHTHTCDCTSHTCVRARTFATHTLTIAILFPPLDLLKHSNTHSKRRSFFLTHLNVVPFFHSVYSYPIFNANFNFLMLDSQR